MELVKIRELSKVASENIAKEAIEDELIGQVAIESMNRSLGSGETKVAEEALQRYNDLVGDGEGNVKVAKIGDFLKLLKTNPKSNELDKAFKLYEKDTGKSKNDMTNIDIDSYVKKIRKIS